MRHSTSATQLLDALSIPYQYVEHEAVHTCEDAARLNIAIQGESLKNIFLCDKKGNHHTLVVIKSHQRLDLHALSQTLGIKGLRFASSGRLMETLGVERGAVSLLALCNDSARLTQVVIDPSIWLSERLLCHPLINTATLSLSVAGMSRFLEHLGFKPIFVDNFITLKTGSG